MRNLDIDALRSQSHVSAFVKYHGGIRYRIDLFKSNGNLNSSKMSKMQNSGPLKFQGLRQIKNFRAYFSMAQRD